MPHDDSVRLRHMLDAAQQAAAFVEGRSRADVHNDLQLRFALLHALQILLEAASRVSDAGREALPEIPWSDMAGMRNRLVHAYFDINLDIVWSTVRDDLPGLVEALRRFPAGE